MAIVLDQLYEELKSIRTYLIKIGPGRRQGNILEIKLNEANSIFKTYSSWLLDFKNDVKEKLKVLISYFMKTLVRSLSHCIAKY